ncbi:MAG: S-formylglutathione hydrolase [Alphaproteobacteria bacterium MarineAlpha3_Bin5]|nr:S-formylglutathione hydrolase [Magnetovibrio sp.]PPR79289.1 MAG: S-formylglutathione hydrolase [Alphaproteobacteria bacterium MarineAlpha3_Bin5]|tara:strand:+ start:538 stop:1380 length:843 start_codon:yes stop_codon:yes gene_type:complete
MKIQTISENSCFNGTQGVYQHFSKVLQCEMRFGLYIPPQAKRERCPILFWLSGLTCTEENFIVKAGSQQYASQYGFIVVAPDTSPRGIDVPNEEAYDIGQGAGFYIDSTESPWASNYKMYSYITNELSDLVFTNFPAKQKRQGIFGHSMGGHGALIMALRNPETFKSVSAFAPITAPSLVPWGKKALGKYLGADSNRWKIWDATELIKSGKVHPKTILIDQGTADDFLKDQLRPEIFEDACEKAKQPIKLRLQPGYDHSYFFISSFIGDHFVHHAELLAL